MLSLDLRDRVVSLLSAHEDLSAKAIFLALRRESGVSVSYQAVHKLLRKLVADGVLVEGGKRYSLNSGWLSNLNSFVSQVEARRSGKPALDFGKIQNASSVTLSFDSYLDALYALLDNMAREIQVDSTPDVTVAHWSHCWPVTCVSPKEFKQLQVMMSQGKHYALVNDKTALDLLLADFWKDLGKKMVLGVPCASQCDLLVTRDRVVQIFLPTPIRTGLDKVFEQSNKGNVDLANFYSLVYGLKGNVSLIVTRNAALAQQIRSETLAYFE